MENAGEGLETGRIERFLCHRGFLTFLVLLGVALRLWSYASNSSLFLDEILVSRNILDLPLGRLLTEPLQLDQVAPRGFLLFEKVFVLAFGENELALRLFPFLCAVAGVFLFRRLADRALDGLAVPFAVGLFAIGVPFINYAAEVKQYGTDATVAIALLLLGMDLRERDASTKRLVIVGLIGFVLIWFSQASVLVMAGIGVALAIMWLVSREARTRRALFITTPIWAAASLVGVVAGMRSMTPSTKEFMADFWAPGFFPLPMKSAGDVAWVWNQALTFFTDPTLLRYRWPVLCLAVALVGFASLWSRRRDVALLLIGPIFVALLAAVAHQYPFRNRLLLYLVPVMLLAIAAGADWVRRAAGRLHPAFGAAVMLALLVPPVVGTIGVKEDSLVLSSFTYPSVSVELYDLSDTNRMQSANAATFPVEPMPTDPRPGCRPWTRPDATNKLF